MSPVVPLAMSTGLYTQYVLLRQGNTGVPGGQDVNTVLDI